MSLKGIIPLMCVALIGGCETPKGSSEITTSTKNAIALCSSVVQVSDSATLKLEAGLAEALEGESSISVAAKIESAVRGVFTEETLKTETGAQAFDSYLSCIKLQLQAYIAADRLES